jgi:hypothetical protein
METLGGKGMDAKSKNLHRKYFAGLNLTILNFYRIMITFKPRNQKQNRLNESPQKIKITLINNPNN